MFGACAKFLGDKYGIRFAFNIKKNISENKLIENAIIEYLEDYY